MFSQIFAIVQLLLKLVGLWEQFLDWSDKKRVADAEEKKQKREKAVDDQKNAGSEDDFDKAQDSIIRNKP